MTYVYIQSVISIHGFSSFTRIAMSCGGDVNFRSGTAESSSNSALTEQFSKGSSL